MTIARIARPKNPKNFPLQVKIPLPASLKAVPGTVKQKLARLVRLRRQQNRSR